MRRIGIWIGLLWWSTTLCSAQTRGPLGAFFFPYRQLLEPKIYRYINLDDPNDIIYQLTHTKVVNGDTLLILKQFDTYFQELESLQQVVTDSGVYLKDYDLYIAGEKVSSRVLRNQVYAWHLPKRDSIKWSVRFESVYGSESFRKMRRLIRRHWRYPYATIRHQAICFRDDFRHSVKTQYGIQTTNFHQFVTYAKGLGLVAYDRTLASGQQLRYRLDRIFDVDEWKELRRRPQKPDIPIKRT